MAFSADNLPALEAHLATSPALSEGGQPGVLDAQIFFALGKLPDLATTPNLHYWYLFLSSFSPFTLKGWVDKAAPAVAAPAPVAAAPAPTPVKDENEVDLFGDEPEEAPVEKPKPKVAAKPKKEKPVAKSILVFDVKVYDEQTDLDELTKKILALEINGLTWSQEVKKLDVAYGIQKLQIGCVIEDDKVLTDDIFDQILAWDEIVQSVDTVSMQKL